MMSEIVNDYYSLIDQSGNEVECELLDLIDFRSKIYAVLMPLASDTLEVEAIFLEVASQDKTEGYTFKGIDSPEILDALYEIFRERFGEDD